MTKTLGEMIMESVKGKVFREDKTNYLYEVTSYSGMDNILQLDIQYASGNRRCVGVAHLRNPLASESQSKAYFSKRAETISPIRGKMKRINSEVETKKSSDKVYPNAAAMDSDFMR